MRDFLEYVEKMKEDSPTSLEFYMEVFLNDISRLEGMNPIKTFILGFLAGKGIDFIKNKELIDRILSNKEITSVSQVISNVKELENTDIKELRMSLNKSVNTLRKILNPSKENKMVEK